MAPADTTRERWALLKARMQELQGSPAWDALISQLDTFIAEQVEALIVDPNPRLAGYIDGLRHFRQYPAELIARVDAKYNS